MRGSSLAVTMSAPGVDGWRQDAFARYVRPELEVLYRAALTLTGQPADAEDLVQETVIRAYRALERFDGRHPRAWLLTIMRHAQVNQNRRRRPRLLDDSDEWERFAAGTSTQAGPEEIVVGNTFDWAVEIAFSALPTKQQRVVELVDIDGLTYGEAAQVLGVKEGTVMSRLHRARTRIRTRLAVIGFPPMRGRA